MTVLLKRVFCSFFIQYSYVDHVVVTLSKWKTTAKNYTFNLSLNQRLSIGIKTGIAKKKKKNLYKKVLLLPLEFVFDKLTIKAP